MNDNLNLVEILRNVTAGTVLYSTIYGNVKFSRISPDVRYPIVLEANNESVSATATGKHFYSELGECTLFPSRDQRDWSKFPCYKDGDVLATTSGAFILKGFNSEGFPVAYCGINTLGNIGISDPLNGWTTRSFTRATKAQIDELFDKLIKQGLIWDPIDKKLINDLPIDTPVMCKDLGKGWALRYYAGNHKVYYQGYSSMSKTDTVSYNYIVPVYKFSFEVGDNNKDKSI